MSIITLPDLEILRPVWTLVNTVQINRAVFGNAQRVLDMDDGYYVGEAEIMPVTTETPKRLWRSFFSQLRHGRAGSANTFRLPVCSCDQHALANPRISAPLNGQTFSNVANTTLTSFTIEKTSGADNTWNASAIVSGDAAHGSGIAVSCRVRSLSDVFVIGLREGANVSSDYPDVTYGLYHAGGSLYGLANGTLTGLLHFLAVGDIIGVIYYGTRVYFFHNGALVYAVDTTAGRTFRFDCSIYKLNSKISDIGFGLMAAQNFVWLAGMPVSSQLLGDGSYATLTTITGGEQLVMVTDDLFGNSNGHGFSFLDVVPRDVPLLGSELETKTPWGLVRLAGGSGAPDESGGVMTWAFEVEEAF